MDDQLLFTNLPSEITIDILSRLPIKTIISCKCVNKPWLHLLQTPEFVKSHLSKSAPGLITYESEMNSEFIKTYELVDEPELDCNDIHYNTISKFDFKEFGDSGTGMATSADGLLFLCNIEVLHVCNPITRDYVVIPGIGGQFEWPSFDVYGFGKSMKRGEYKIVRLFLERTREPSWYKIKNSRFECQVYTIGTGSWRSITPDNAHEYNNIPYGTFHAGNIHWLVADLISGVVLISCFDLEKERFGVISPPPDLPDRDRSGFFGCLSLGVLENHLCLSDNTSGDEVKVDMWIMKEYGVEKSWTKQFVISISNIPDFVGGNIEVVYASKVFKDGYSCLAWDNYALFYYSNRTESSEKDDDHVEMRKASCIGVRPHVPSFVSLKSFVMENVRSF